jgi:hypothetical protein
MIWVVVSQGLYIEQEVSISQFAVFPKVESVGVEVVT